MSKHTPLVLIVAALATIAAFAAASSRTSAATVIAAASCPTVASGQLTIGTDNPAYPPWYAGGSKTSKWKINDPSTGKGYESAVAYAIAVEARLLEEPGEVDLRPLQQGVRPGEEVVRLRHQPDLVHAGSREGRRLQRLLLRREPGDRRQQGHEDRVGPIDRRTEAVQARRAARNDELPVHQEPHQAVTDSRPCTRPTPAQYSR